MAEESDQRKWGDREKVLSDPTYPHLSRGVGIKMVKKTIVLFLLGVILGAVFSFGSIYYFYENAASEFILTQLSEQERISVEAFNNYSKEENISTQTNYLLFVESARKGGLISESEYNRAALLANIRLCIIYEDEGIDIVKSTCKWARDHLLLSKSGWDYEEIMNKQREARIKKEIPDFSLAIIRQSVKNKWGQIKLF